MHYKEYLYFKGILDYIIDIPDTKYLAHSIYQTIYKIESNTKFNNILIIEKSKRICEQIKDIMLPRNYEVSVINDLEQAYEILKTKSYSLVILDINYNNCFEFLSNVRSNIDKSIPFIMLTETNRTYDIVREAYKHGISECLRKPIFAEEFILKVDQLIDHFKLIYNIMEKQSLLDSYRKIVDISTIVSKTDPKGIITYVNKTFCDISGYDKDELIGESHNIIRHPKISKEIFKEMWKTIKNDKKIWSGIITNKNKQGEDYIVKTHIMPVVDLDGNISEFIALRTDITEIYKRNNI